MSEIASPADLRAAGRSVRVGGDEVFVADLPALSDEGERPLVVVHGFPTSSLDWVAVLPALRERRRVVLFDLPGFGWSAKPDRPYGIAGAADAAQGVLAALHLEAVDLITHDMGDTVGGELLARDQEGRLGVSIGARVLVNGSIYLDLAHLTAGQQALWAAPDEMLAADSAPNAELLEMSLVATLAPAGSPTSHPDPSHLRAAADAICERDGNRLLPRLIRYLSDRRDNEARYTGAIESHPSPVTVVWGDADPIAVVAMAHRLVERRPDAALSVLEGVGHYPMIEAPEPFAAAVLAGL